MNNKVSQISDKILHQNEISRSQFLHLTQCYKNGQKALLIQYYKVV